MNTAGRWKTAVVVLGICCLALVYRIFDQGISRTYLSADRETCTRHTALLIELIEHEWIGHDQGQIMSRLKAYVATKPEGSIILKQDPIDRSIALEGIRFEFRDGKLARVL